MTSSSTTRKKPFIIDGHLDLAYNALSLERDIRRPLIEIRQKERHAAQSRRGTCLVSIPELLKGRITLIGASIFVGPASKRSPNGYHNSEEAHQHAVAQLDYYRRLSEEDQRVCLVKTSDDLETVLAAGGKR